MNIIFQERFEQMFDGLIGARLVVLGLANHDVVEGFAQGFLVKIPEIIQFRGIVFDPFFDDLIGFVFHRQFFIHEFKIGVRHGGIQRYFDFDDVEQRFRRIDNRQIPGLLPFIGKKQVIPEGIE